MINVEELEKAIKESGKTYTYLAEKLGISLQNFRLKCKGLLDFRLSEVKRLCVELNITDTKRMKKIFGFMQNKSSTRKGH